MNQIGPGGSGGGDMTLYDMVNALYESLFVPHEIYIPSIYTNASTNGGVNELVLDCSGLSTMTIAAIIISEYKNSFLYLDGLPKNSSSFVTFATYTSGTSGGGYNGSNFSYDISNYSEVRIKSRVNTNTNRSDYISLTDIRLLLQ